MPLQESEILFGVALVIGFIFSLTVFVVFSIIRSQRKLIKIKEEILLSELRTIEKERTTISNNLHDDLGPSLSYVKMLLQGIRTTDNDAIEDLKKSDAALKDCISTVRQISYGIMPPGLDSKGFNEALSESGQKLLGSANIHFEFQTEYTNATLNVESEVNLFRILRELMNNTVKYSECSEVKITISIKNKFIQILYHDNGIGLPQNLRDFNQKGTGLGLMSIKARVKFLNGHVKYASEWEKGFNLYIQIPISKN